MKKPKLELIEKNLSAMERQPLENVVERLIRYIRFLEDRDNEKAPS